jgi:LAO/AO transport system kinase
MLTSASTGSGVPELLAALDRRDAERRAAGSQPTDAAALKRAEAQLSGILSERIHRRLHDAEHQPTTEATLRRIAAHDVDPYSAADELLRALSGSGRA